MALLCKDFRGLKVEEVWRFDRLNKLDKFHILLAFNGFEVLTSHWEPDKRRLS